MRGLESRESQVSTDLMYISLSTRRWNEKTSQKSETKEKRWTATKPHWKGVAAAPAGESESGESGRKKNERKRLPAGPYRKCETTTLASRKEPEKKKGGIGVCGQTSIYAARRNVGRPTRVASRRVLSTLDPFWITCPPDRRASSPLPLALTRNRSRRSVLVLMSKERHWAA
ncbi:hypothetical protein TNCV_4426891 [Trichonephila clavipes]|nr:hypothetical protein TNCV_4426891 [Trichonephila clavipes]